MGITGKNGAFHGKNMGKTGKTWEKHRKMMEKAGKTVASPGRFNAKMMEKHGLTHTKDEKVLGSPEQNVVFMAKMMV